MKRPNGRKDKQPISCLTCVQDYNLYMGGVDLIDQWLSYPIASHIDERWSGERKCFVGWLI